VSVPSVQSVSPRCCEQYRVPSSDPGRPSSDNEWVKRIEQSERTGTEWSIDHALDSVAQMDNVEIDEKAESKVLYP